MRERNTAVALTTIALGGASLEVDATEYTLLALTQIACALRGDSTLTIRNGEFLTPLERACISTVTSHPVQFAKDDTNFEGDNRAVF